MYESTNEAIAGLYPQNIKSDLLYFKDDILKDMREIQKTLDSKFFQSEENLNLKLNKFETKINLFEQKIFELSKKISADNNLRENVELLTKFKEETSDTIFKRRAKYNELEKRINVEMNRINDILVNSVIYPSFIGNKSKFKTFHEYMDYTLEEIGQFKVFRDKTGLDLGPFKRKIDQSIEALKLQINNINNMSKEFTINSIKQSEERIKNIIKIYDDRLQDSRVDNSHYNVGLDKKFEVLKEEFNKLAKIQDNLAIKFQKQINGYNKLEEIFNYYNNEINEINNKINKLNYIMKELLSLKNIKIKEKKGKIFSGVKQYIKGNLNAIQLSTMKNFKKYEDSSNDHGDIIRRTSTEFRQKNIAKNDLSKSNNTYNRNIELQKSYSNMKSENYNYLNSLNKGFQEEKNNNNKNNIYYDKDLSKNINNKIYNKMEEIKEEEILKKKTLNYSSRSENINNKFNDEIENKQNYNKSKNRKSIEKEKDNICNGEKRRNSKNSLKFSNSSNSINDSKKELLLNFSEESKNNSSKKINKRNGNIIKEEDENNKSDNSFLKIKEENKYENNNKNIKKDIKINKNKSKEEKTENKKDFIKDKINIKKLNKKDLNEKINDNNNYFNHSNKNSLENKKEEKNYNYKISLNSIRKNNEYNYVPILEILNSEPNENKKIRSQSSKKRNINNINLLNKNINLENRQINNTYRIKAHSDNKAFLKTNYQNNLEYQNFPYLNKDKNISNKIKTIPKSALNRTKLNKFNSTTNVQINISQKANKNKFNRAKLFQTLNPDKIFSNAIISKKSKKIGKNKSIGIGYERSNEAKQIEELFYKLQSYIPQYESYLTQDEY